MEGFFFLNRAKLTRMDGGFRREMEGRAYFYILKYEHYKIFLKRIEITR